MKVKLALFTIMGFFLMTPIALATPEDDAKEELNRLMAEKFNGESIELDSVNPNDFNNKAQAIEYYQLYVNNEFYTEGYEIFLKFANDDYTKATVELIKLVDDKEVKVTKEINVTWQEADESIKTKIAEIDTKFTALGDNYVTDLYALKFFKTAKNNSRNVDKLNEIINDENITYAIDQQAGDYPTAWHPYANLGWVYLFYNNILYGTTTGGNNIYNIIYIPSDTTETKDDYIKAAQAKINKYYKDITITSSSKEFSKNGDSTYDKLIDANLNANLGPIPIEINIGEDSYDFLVVKGTEEQLNDIPKDLEEIKDNTETTPEDTKDNTDTSQEENPSTGASIPIVLFIMFGLLGVILLLKNKNKRIYKI